MKKITILIPVYNDWESLVKLLDEINLVIQDIKEFSFNCIIVDDASSIKFTSIKLPKNITSLKIIHMKENRGHARCNAYGIKYMSETNEFDYLILMDGDGEDRPVEIKDLIKKISSNQSSSVVAKRIKRSEGFFFQTLYQFHKALVLIFTGKNINFGNYSCIINRDVKILSEKASLWSSFSGSFKKHIKNFNEINSIRGLRYFGPSKMSLYNLGIHSLAIIAVFKKEVFLRSTLLIIFLSYLSLKINMMAIIAQILLVMFNLLIYLISLRENENELNNSSLNKENSVDITH
jgi:hypothetical protein